MIIETTMDYQNKTGYELDSGSGSERWCSLRRYESDGSFSRLFVARFKYLKPGTKANRYCRWLRKNCDLNTVTQEELDSIRERYFSIPRELRS